MDSHISTLVAAYKSKIDFTHVSVTSHRGAFVLCQPFFRLLSSSLEVLNMQNHLNDERMAKRDGNDEISAEFCFLTVLTPRRGDKVSLKSLHQALFTSRQKTIRYHVD
jgi:hypothetical protein